MRLGGTAGAAAKVQCTQTAADLPIVSGKQVEPEISLHSPRSSFSSLTPGSGVWWVQPVFMGFHPTCDLPLLPACLWTLGSSIKCGDSLA